MKAKHQHVPPPFNVSVTCDSYGVVVEWMASGLNDTADFLLKLQPDFGENTSVSTKHLRYNISELMLDTAYNRYVVRVAARDGEQESEFAESQIFTYNYLDELQKVVCDLEFPQVNLIPKDGKLIVKFPNPLHLYRDTPALRNLQYNEQLNYHLTSEEDDGSQARHKKYFNSDVKHRTERLLCFAESDTCESSLEFPEKLEEYCVTLQGRIRHTRVRKSGPHCYKGTLYPGPPISTILILLLVALAVFATLALIVVLLGEMIIKKQGKKIFPDILKDKHSTTLIRLLKPSPEPVDENLSIEPAVVVSLDVLSDTEENTLLQETSTCSNVNINYTKSKNLYTSSGSSELEGNGYGKDLNGFWDGDGDGDEDGDLDEDGYLDRDYDEDRDEADRSGSTLSSGYDRPHIIVKTR
ncbi:interferon gamma receptor 1 precursor [Silurus asotus]|uniref:Interferon gamma receptor 1 n=1 Tax=Silurus asotus TaxID=30991 RepID=A0AAD5B0W8_SILAS|nr:interferon gamma receptor 1 precursor [Silurus asotus]